MKKNLNKPKYNLAELFDANASAVIKANKQAGERGEESPSAMHVINAAFNEAAQEIAARQMKIGLVAMFAVINLQSIINQVLTENGASADAGYFINVATSVIATVILFERSTAMYKAATLSGLQFDYRDDYSLDENARGNKAVYKRAQGKLDKYIGLKSRYATPFGPTPA